MIRLLFSFRWKSDLLAARRPDVLVLLGGGRVLRHHADQPVRHIGRLEGCDLLIGELEVDSARRALDVVQLCRADEMCIRDRDKAASSDMS